MPEMVEEDDDVEEDNGDIIPDVSTSLNHKGKLIA